MKLSPQSKEIISKILLHEKIKSIDLEIGPFDDTTASLLEIILSNFEDIESRKGDDQVKVLRESFIQHLKEKKDNKNVKVSDGNDSDTYLISNSKSVMNEPNWRLISLKCNSIRGIAKHGEDFEFNFGGNSNLIYGPNGSGKSSLLGAVIWVLNDSIIIDCDNPNEQAALFKCPTDKGRGSKLRQWPVVITLPESSHCESASLDCWAQLELNHKNSVDILYLKRIYGKGLKTSKDGIKWNVCTDLSEYGIQPLDLQLSLIAPTMFGRRSIEEAKDTRNILSLILGYDDLETIGELASRISGNRTILATKEQKALNQNWKELRQELHLLPDLLPDENNFMPNLEKLAEIDSPTVEDLGEINTQLNETINNAEQNLAKILGLPITEGKAPTKLADRLTVVFSALEKGFLKNFPLLAELRLDTLLPESEGKNPEERLNDIINKITCYATNTKARIENRLEWWRKEMATSSKLSLLLKAANYYDPQKQDCPVCGQSISHLHIKEELADLKKIDKELSKEVRMFFTDLDSELKRLIPESFQKIEIKSLNDRILKDWSNLRDKLLGDDFKLLSDRFNEPIKKILEEIITIEVPEPKLLPEEIEPDLKSYAKQFVYHLSSIYKTFGILLAANSNFPSITKKLHDLVTNKTINDPPSLLFLLSKGKESAENIRPMKNVKNNLKKIIDKRESITKYKAMLDVLKTIKSPLDKLKLLSKYAVNEVGLIFDSIKDTTIDNWKKLYPESSTGMEPARIVMGKGKDKSIEALLSLGNYEVQGKYFTNIGLQRAIALSFYFALLDKHPHGLGFILMDDPILSLDEDHRERWSRNLLCPKLKELQIILATHQRQYLRSCGNDFEQDYVIELNHRTHAKQISYRPGNRLKRAENQLLNDWSNTPNIMRKFREDVLLTLDSYSPKPFIEKNLTNSFNNYASFRKPHPMASNNQRKIVDLFKKKAVNCVLDPGSHSLTESDITKPMCEDCLKELFECDKKFRSELERLENLKKHDLKGSAITASIVPFKDITEELSWNEPINLEVLGHAAAKPDSWIVDISEESHQISVSEGSAVLATSDTLDPVVKTGQWVILESEGNEPEDGDLVAVIDIEKKRFLRRIYSDGNKWILHSINPIKHHKSIGCEKIASAVRRIIGVIYEPLQSPTPGNHGEWEPLLGFDVEKITQYKIINVEGYSLDPIARKGQKVLVKQPQSLNEKIFSGTLAVLETTNERIGSVIKRVYPQKDSWVLISPNPVDQIPPIILPIEQIIKVWTLVGVLFEVLEND